MMFSAPSKDPVSQLDYTIDWSMWLTPIADTIVTSTWVVPGGLSMVSTANTTTTATIWLKGGSPNETYDVVNKITTASSPDRIEEVTLRIQMQR